MSVKEGGRTIFLPIQSNHLNSLLPEGSRLKVVTRKPRHAGIHPDQVSQIMFLDLMIRLRILEKFFDLWFRKTKNVVVQRGLGQRKVLPFVRFGIDGHLGQHGENLWQFGWFVRCLSGGGLSTRRVWTFRFLRGSDGVGFGSRFSGASS